MLPRPLTAVLVVPLLIGACGSAIQSPVPASPGTEVVAVSEEPDQPVNTAEPIEASLINPRIVDEEIYRIPRLLPLDGILPVYGPLFEPAELVKLVDEELVIGVEIEGEAKAYPISVLRFREMVNDELAGLPFLVSW
jgi:hypothetical protein